MPDYPTLTTARTAAEILEAVGRFVYWEDYKSDCPPEKIPSVAAMGEWLPNSPPEAWAELWERSRANTLGRGRGKGGPAFLPPPIETFGRPRSTTATPQASRIASTDTYAAFSLIRTGMMAAHDWRWDNERRDLFPAHLFRWHPLGPAIEELHDQWRRPPQPKHPLAPLVKAWQNRPVPVEPETRRDRILPGPLAMVSNPEDPRVHKQLFSMARHLDPQPQKVLPGFERRDRIGPCLPLELFELGGGSSVTAGRGGPAPLALRLFIEGVLSVRTTDRNGHPVALEMSMREMVRKLWAFSKRKPGPNRYSPAMEGVAKDLNDLWLPTPTGGIAKLVMVTRLEYPAPSGRRGSYPGLVRMVVDLPPGSERGPIVSPRLNQWGGSAPAYRGLLNLAYRWYNPGVTRVPVGRGTRRYWVHTDDPKRYDRITDALLIETFFPVSATKHRRQMVLRAHKVLDQLKEAGELRVVDNRILPPKVILTDE